MRASTFLVAIAVALTSFTSAAIGFAFAFGFATALSHCHLDLANILSAVTAVSGPIRVGGHFLTGHSFRPPSALTLDKERFARLHCHRFATLPASVSTGVHFTSASAPAPASHSNAGLRRGRCHCNIANTVAMLLWLKWFQWLQSLWVSQQKVQ